MNRKIRIAVTGVAGASGQSILKSANMLGDKVETWPVDVTPFSAGLFMGSVGGTVLPKPEENIEAWAEFVEKNQIDAVIPGADRDLIPLAHRRVSTKAIVSPAHTLNICRDKFITASFLAKRFIPVPKTAATISDIIPEWVEYPVVVKPRNDAAMRGFNICHDKEELLFHKRRTHDAMIQEYLRGREFSVNVFCDRNGEPKASLVMERIMRDGVAYMSQAVDDEALRKFGFKIAKLLRPLGTINIQLMREDGGNPMIFEINARMSGSTTIRSILGYNDLEMAINHFVLGEDVIQPKIDYNKFVFRYYEEIYVNRKLLPDFNSRRVL